MLICAAGDVHGAMDRRHEAVLAFEGTLGVRFEWVLHVGDFGVWPDPNRIDMATKKHDGAGDFPAWLWRRDWASDLWPPASASSQKQPFPKPEVGGPREASSTAQKRRAR